MFLRRCAAAVAATTALCAAAAPFASASPGAPAAGDPGLYGTGDPRYDGVWRQSLALVAQDAAGVTPVRKAVDWLAEQQCADGSFAAYRPDPEQDCDRKTKADTNATAVAVQALAALGGHGAEVRRSVEWLTSVQNADGGWGYNPGSPTDANSVSVVIGALSAAGRDPAKTERKGASPYDALLGLQIGCDRKPAERGAFAYQPDEKGALAPNDDATAAAVLAAQGEDFVVEKPAKDAGKPGAEADCEWGDATPTEEGRRAYAAELGSARLARELDSHGGHLQSAMPGAEKQPDYGNTADAVLALAAGGYTGPAGTALDWLEQHLGDWEKSADDPAALGQLVLAAHALGADPRDFGGADLVRRLNATGPEPAADDGAAGTADGTGGGGQDGAAEDGEDDGGTVTLVSMVVAGLAGGAGIGVLLSGRRKRQGL
ncbi:prenyltransferase/squalene oxidase repeat-containing protein [Streptomyces sp. JJ36]|uniref:prenyltransferase/squalene oxidase repeat-containing protein n=1 Tax=Streptomyces sp. JJ36 TaxID=2736645 RepID=UPI001F486FDD|nr:prenyltransferase/squalene oxidase repeat-containing protein [Streptomyces sp. JJ36]MCF6526590.1 hypothetical protein [Streptomyces sp. JJ36]